MADHRIVLSQFLAGGVAIFTIVVALVTGMYLRAIAIVEGEFHDRNQQLLERTRDLVDAHLDQVEGILTRIERSPAIASFLDMEPLEQGSPAYMIVIDAFDELREYRVRNDFVRAVYLYARKSGIVISSEAVYLDPEVEYGYTFAYGSASWEFFKRRLLDPPTRNAFFPRDSLIVGPERTFAVLCANTLPLNSSRYTQGTLIAAIDAGILSKLLGELALSPEGAALVMDGKGTVLNSVGAPAAVAAGITRSPGAGGKEHLFFETSSASYGLRFVSIVPLSTYRRRITVIQRTAFVLAALFIAFGGLVSYLLALRGAKPLVDIARTLRSAYETGGLAGDDLLGTIRGGLRGLIRVNAELRTLSEAREPLFRYMTLRAILEGTLHDVGDGDFPVQGLVSDLGLEEGVPYRVCLFSFSDIGGPYSGEKLHDLEMRLVILSGLLDRRFPRLVFPCDMGRNRVALLFMAEGTEAGRIGAFHREAGESYGFSLLLAQGPVVPRAEDASVSYRAASRLLDWGLSFGSRRHALLVDTDRTESRAPFPYPLEYEEKVLSLVKSGNSQALDAALSALWVRHGADPTAGNRLIVAGLETTLHRLIADIGEQGIDLPDFPEDGQGRLVVVSETLRSLCDRRRWALGGEDRELQARLVEYLETHYSDLDLNLYKVARDFEKKESFLYYFFKDAFGVTFATYVEGLRMKRAAELLGRSDVPIGETSVRCGYGSAHSFRRAFKRVYGVGPAEYRTLKRRSPRPR